MTTSICSVVEAAGAVPKVTVTLPPPAGTVLEPLALALPLLTVAWIVAPPQADASPLTVTLATVLPDRFWITDGAPVMQRGTLIDAAPSVPLVAASDAAAPDAKPLATPMVSNRIKPLNR